VALPFLPVAAFGFLTAVVVALAHTQPANHTSNVGGAVAVAWGIIGLACGAGCVRTCRAALFAVRIPPARLLAALACGTLVTAGMLVVAAVTAIYAVALNLDASGLAATSNGPFGILSTSASLIVQVVVMAAAGAVATVTTRRGWRALQAG
jgi:hypothetical protein